MKALDGLLRRLSIDVFGLKREAEIVIGCTHLGVERFSRLGKLCLQGGDALLVLQGRANVAPMPMFKAVLAAPIRKAPGRTEFQRGVLAPDGAGGWQVRTTGDQGSGILSSMSQANCFIVLPAETGNVDAGAMVDVQLLEGLI